MNEMGLILHGLFIGAEAMRPDDKGNVRWVALLTVGATAYRVYVDDDSVVAVRALAFGQDVYFRVRCFAGRSGVGFSGGLVVDEG